MPRRISILSMSSPVVSETSPRGSPRRPLPGSRAYHRGATPFGSASSIQALADHDAVPVDRAEAEFAHLPGLVAEGLHHLRPARDDARVVGLYLVDDEVGEVRMV